MTWPCFGAVAPCAVIAASNSSSVVARSTPWNAHTHQSLHMFGVDTEPNIGKRGGERSVAERGKAGCTLGRRATHRPSAGVEACQGAHPSQKTEEKKGGRWRWRWDHLLGLHRSLDGDLSLSARRCPPPASASPHHPAPPATTPHPPLGSAGRELMCRSSGLQSGVSVQWTQGGETACLGNPARGGGGDTGHSSPRCGGSGCRCPGPPGCRHVTRCPGSLEVQTLDNAVSCFAGHSRALKNSASTSRGEFDDYRRVTD